MMMSKIVFRILYLFFSYYRQGSKCSSINFLSKDAGAGTQSDFSWTVHLQWV